MTIPPPLPVALVTLLLVAGGGGGFCLPASNWLIVGTLLPVLLPVLMAARADGFVGLGGGRFWMLGLGDEDVLATDAIEGERPVSASIMGR